MKNTRFILALSIASASSLTGCASVALTPLFMTGQQNTMYSGTRANISIIRQDECDTRTASTACAYSKLLTPLSIIDFVPSMAMDTLLLPVTAVHALTLPRAHGKESKASTVGPQAPEEREKRTSE